MQGTIVVFHVYQTIQKLEFNSHLHIISLLSVSNPHVGMKTYLKNNRT